MSVKIPNGTIVSIAASYGAEKTMSAVSNASPAIATLPSKRNARIQVNVWDTTRDGADALALQADNALRAYLSLQTEVLGEPVALAVDDQELYGTMQDFSVWA